jgi:hypothetical protein
MPPLVADCDNNDYDSGEEEDGEGETPEEHAKILHCIFRDFCRPPPSIGWALTALCRGERRAPDDDDDNDDDEEGGDEEEVDGQ